MGDDKVLNLINLIKQYQARLDASSREGKRNLLATQAQSSNIPQKQIPQYIEQNIGDLEKIEGVADVSGGVRKLATQMPREIAEQILKKVPTDDIAINLKGNDKLNYFDALDSLYGNAEQRALDLFGIDLNKLQKAHDKVNKLTELYEPNSYTNAKYIFNEEGEIIDEIPKGLGMEVVEKSTNKTIGRVPTINKGDYNVVDDADDGVEQLVYVNPEHRRKGIGSLMYNMIEKETGYPMKRSTSQTSDGKYFWNSKNAALSDGEISNLVDRKKSILEKGSLTNDDMEKIKDIDWEIGTIRKEKDRYKQEYRAFGNERHPEAAFDPRFKDSKKILAGTIAAPLAVDSTLEESESYQNLRNLLKGNK